MVNDTSIRDAEPSLPWALLDSLLLRAPVDVLLLDTELICRYAAPVEDRFLGRPRDALAGRHVTEIFPPAANGLRPVLERAAHESVPWGQTQYQFMCPIDDIDTSFCAAIQIEPVDVANYRGVLIMLADARELQHLAETQERLRSEVGLLRRTLQELRAAVRSVLTPVSGYLQMIARGHPALAAIPTNDLITRRVLPSIEAMVRLVDEMSQTPPLDEALAIAEDQGPRAGGRETDTRTDNG